MELEDPHRPGVWWRRAPAGPEYQLRWRTLQGPGETPWYPQASCYPLTPTPERVALWVRLEFQ